MPKKYIVELSCDEQKSLKKSTTTGKHAAYKINHARILLLADINQSEASWSDESIAKALGISIPTVERVRRRFVTEGMDAALNYRSGRGRTLDNNLNGGNPRNGFVSQTQAFRWRK